MRILLLIIVLFPIISCKRVGVYVERTKFSASSIEIMEDSTFVYLIGDGLNSGMRIAGRYMRNGAQISLIPEFNELRIDYVESSIEQIVIIDSISMEYVEFPIFEINEKGDTTQIPSTFSFDQKDSVTLFIPFYNRHFTVYRRDNQSAIVYLTWLNNFNLIPTWKLSCFGKRIRSCGENKIVFKFIDE